MIARIERRTLREQVLDQLTDEILSGALSPGTHLSEVALAETFSVSRGTIREALRSLQQAQLAEEAPRGLQVRTMSAQEVQDLYATRGALESLAVTTVMSKSNAPDIITSLFDLLPTENPEQNDFAEVLTADLNFHRALVEASQNKVLMHLWDGLQNQMKVAILSDRNSKVQTLMSRNHHLPILEAMTAGDQNEAARLLTEHMGRAAELLGARH